MKNTSDLLFVARYKWPLRVVAVGLAMLLVVLRPSVVEIWGASRWSFGGGLVFLYGLATAFLLEVFVRRTWLTDKGIFQRSMFGKTTFVPYGQIEEFLIQRHEALVVRYQGEQRLKVYAIEGNPKALIEVARRHLDPNLRVVTI
jgi:hypothetical protein